jgi:hypothetical protein
MDMAADISVPGATAVASLDAGIRSDNDLLRTLVVVAGLGCSILFIVVGVRYGLQMYADGSAFSYAIAVDDAWAFHWHNISGRLFVYLYSSVPAELYVRLTGDAHGAIVIYGLLFFAAPLLGLVATFAADRSIGRVIFSYACCSTACLCPLVFGFPTEMWVAHSIFWPTLAACHYALGGTRGIVLVFAMMLALVLTHGGALILAVAILATLSLRGARDPAFLRAAGVFFTVLAIWTIVKTMFPPDDYLAAVLLRAALHVFDPAILSDYLIVLLGGTLASYAIGVSLLKRLSVPNAHVYAALIVAGGLFLYWSEFDHSLHADGRYGMRTVLIVMTPMLGALAVGHAFRNDGRFGFPWLRRTMAALTGTAASRTIAGALVLVLLVHAVETVKFVAAWSRYEHAVKAQAIGSSSDPALGDPQFVSSRRIGADLNRLSWFSTTHFLSVLVAPKLAPARLVVDPASNFFWLSCKTATANLVASHAVPMESRRLIRAYSCLHR